MTPDPDDLAYAPWAAMAWHGGQRCPLYAYGSSGMMVAGLAAAARRAADLAAAEVATCPDSDVAVYLQDVASLQALALAADAAEVTP
jgi:hypothetical protein